MKINRMRDLAIALVAFVFTFLMPGMLIGADIPSVEDVVKGNAKIPTIEQLTDGKVRNDGLIDRSNVELVAKYMTGAMYENVKKGMVLKMGAQQSLNQLYPKAYKEATERNRGKAVIDNNGVVYYEKVGTPWPGGIPFPWAKTGLEAMSNYHFGRIWDSYRGLIDMWYVNPSGEVYKTVGMEHLYVKCNGRTTVPPLGTISGHENIMIKRVSVLTYPLDVKGLGQFSVRYYDPAKTYDTGFAYIPAFKRTLRVNASTWQDNVAGSDMTYGDGDSFQEPYFDWDLKLLGKKFLLVPEPKNPFPIYDERGRLNNRMQFDMGKKFPRVGWVIWPVDVVEATPKIKHVYGKKVVYIPIWPYAYSGTGIVAADMYDRQMRLWKGILTMFGRTEYSNGDQQQPNTPLSGFWIYDLQTGHATQLWMRQILNAGLAPKDITLTTLLDKGR